MERIIERSRKPGNYYYVNKNHPSMTGVSNLSKNSIHEMEFHFYGKIYNINQNSSGLIFVVRVLPLFGLFFIP